MTITKHNRLLLYSSAFIAISLSACSKQAWYQSVASTHETNCRNGPVSEYDDCMKQSDGTYNEYEKKRDVVFTPPSQD